MSSDPLVVDAGGLIAVERQQRAVLLMFERAVKLGATVSTPSTALAEVYRGAGPRQAVLERALRGMAIVPIDVELARAAGRLLAAARSSHTLDAIVIALAASVGGWVLTTDPHDLALLAKPVGVRVVRI